MITRFIVFGCGHSGTTLVGGLLHLNGFRNLNLTREFENRKLNDICYRIMRNESVSDKEIIRFFKNLDRRTHGRWSIKSPHLSETIARIYPLIKYPVKIIFHIRAPGSTIAHLLKERRVNWPDSTDEERMSSAENEWRRRNQLSLEFLDNINNSSYLITDYDEMIEGKHDDVLCRFVEQSLDLSFIEPRKRRSSPITVSKDIEALYSKLTERRISNNAEVMREYKAMPVCPRSKKIGVRLAILRNKLSNTICRQQGRSV